MRKKTSQKVDKKADIATKRLIGVAPDPWVRWALGREDVTAHEILTGELQWMNLSSDAVVRVSSPSLGKFIALFEIQKFYNKEIPRRMRAYAALAELKFKLPVYPVLVVLRGSPRVTIAERYSSDFHGLHAQQDYRIIKLWEMQAVEVLTQPVPTLFQLIPFMRGGKRLPVIKHAAEQLLINAEIRHDDMLRDGLLALFSFAREVLDNTTFHSLLRWGNMIELIRDTRFYQELRQEAIQLGLEEGRQEGRQEGQQIGQQIGREEGRQEGLQQGMQQGMQQGFQRVLLGVLRRHVGEIDEPMMAQLRELSEEEAITLVDNAYRLNSLTDLKAWLERVH